MGNIGCIYAKMTLHTDGLTTWGTYEGNWLGWNLFRAIRIKGFEKEADFFMFNFFEYENYLLKMAAEKYSNL